MSSQKKRNHKKKKLPFLNKKLISKVILTLVASLLCLWIVDYFIQSNHQTDLTSSIHKELETDSQPIDNTIINYPLDVIKEPSKQNDPTLLHQTKKDEKSKEITTSPPPTDETPLLDHPIDGTENNPLDKTTSVQQEEKRPKLAIVIDDITSKRQINAIKKIELDLTIALIPPLTITPKSVQLTQGLDFYMIHLPLQAHTSKHEEKSTLYVTHSSETIEQRIQNIREYYPNASYINNHTGSKFTSNTVAMERLFKALKKFNFHFLDSRTTPKTVAQHYAKQYNISFLQRNVFLDNQRDETYILNQLKKAIKLAKKNGHAIAIGHPYKSTLNALSKAKPLLETIDVVYLNQIPFKSL